MNILSHYFDLYKNSVKSAEYFLACPSFFSYHFAYKCWLKVNHIRVERGENSLSNGKNGFFPKLCL